MTVLTTGGILMSEVKENSLSAVPLEAGSDISERYTCCCLTADIVIDHRIPRGQFLGGVFFIR